MSFIVESSSAIHEGGTKFYQLISVHHTIVNRSVLFLHYGYYTKESTLIPNEHGKVDLVRIHGNPKEQFRKKKAAKTSRGYKFENSSSHQEGFDDLLCFDKYMTAKFSNEQIKQVLDFIWAGEVPIDEIQAKPESKVSGFAAYGDECGAW